MERYIGCDVHASSTTVSVRNASGKRLRRDVVETNGEALISYLQGLGGKQHLCLEESEWSQWLAEILWREVVELVVVQPERRRGSKSDAIDADDLSERVRTGDLGRVVFKDRGRYTDLRELVRAYDMITRDVVRTKNRLKGFYRSRGVRCPGGAVYRAESGAELARRLPRATQRAVSLLRGELEALEPLKAEAGEAMVRESHRHAITRILETAPGLGPVRVAQLLPIVVTPHRFRTKRQFWSYCGLGIETHSSADWVLYEGRWVKAAVTQTRGLNRDSNRRLKAIFKSAAITVIRARSGALWGKYEDLLADGTKPNLAKLTIARKIAAIVLAMWKQEERYRPKKTRVLRAARRPGERAT
jgi:transposase